MFSEFLITFGAVYLFRVVLCYFTNEFVDKR